MEVLDYLTIFIFSLIILGAGLSFGKQGGDMKSFFAAGGAVPWSISGLSLFMSFFSAGTFVVWGSIAYEWGWVAITIQMMMSAQGEGVLEDGWHLLFRGSQGGWQLLPNDRPSKSPSSKFEALATDDYGVFWRQ